MEIPWAMRTDNDIVSVKGRKDVKRFAGANRCLKAAGVKNCNGKACDHLTPDLNITHNIIFSNGFWKRISNDTDPFGVFLAIHDLENDLARELPKELCAFAKKTEDDISGAVDYLQGEKAIRMRKFLVQQGDALESLMDGELAKPLLYCRDQVKGGTANA